jgi:hypothetical protein
MKKHLNSSATPAIQTPSPSEKIKYKHLECVLKMREPNSIEITHLHEFIAYSFSGFNLHENLTRDFFGFEKKKLESGTEQIIAFLESISVDPKMISMSNCKYLILGLMACIYLRLYDTRRFSIYLNMWRLMQSICKLITKLRISFETDNEGMMIANVMSVIVQRTKNFWDFLTENRRKNGEINENIDYVNELDIKQMRLISSKDQLSPAKLEQIFNTPLQQIKGKFKLQRLHSLILKDVSLKGISCDLSSKIFIYRILIKNSRFAKDDPNEIFPRYSIKNLFELIFLEHLTLPGLLDIFQLFWSDLSDKIKYFLNFYQFVKGDPDKSVHFIDNFILSMKSLNTKSSNILLDREILRLTAINGFFTSNPQIFQPNLQNENMNLVNKVKKNPQSFSSLYLLTFVKIIREAIEKLMGLDFKKFLREEKNSQSIVTQTQENLDKDAGVSVLSKSILGDESILGSMINIDFNENNPHPKDNSK